jgi:hypothetical protein
VLCTLFAWGVLLVQTSYVSLASCFFLSFLCIYFALTVKYLLNFFIFNCIISTLVLHYMAFYVHNARSNSDIKPSNYWEPENVVTSFIIVSNGKCPFVLDENFILKGSTSMGMVPLDPSSIYLSVHLAHSRVICLTCWSIPNSLPPLLHIPHIPSPLAWSRCQNPGSILRFGQSVKQSEGGGVGFSGKRRILNGPALPRSHLAPLRCPAWPTYVASRQPADLEGKSWRLAGT